jgi:DNA-binding transcriptional ArsR family regulator
MFQGVKGEADLFAVLGHPVRRALLDHLREADGGEQPVKRLAAPFAISRPAISQHLAVLLAAGLVRERKVGRERHYRLEGARLREVYQWAGRYARFWQGRLDALELYLDETAPPEDPPRGRRAGAGTAGEPGDAP